MFFNQILAEYKAIRIHKSALAKSKNDRPLWFEQNKYYTKNYVNIQYSIDRLYNTTYQHYIYFNFAQYLQQILIDPYMK